MSYLGEIRDFAQQVAEAIASVIDIEVTIIDDELIRVVGTGKYKNDIGQKLPPWSVSDQILKYGKTITVFEPRVSKTCQLCSLKDVCQEHAEICFPIKLQEKTIGNLGLIAFSDEQKHALIQFKDSLIDFLEKMAALISSKVSDHNKSVVIYGLKSKLEKVIDSVEEGILVTDDDGIITYINSKMTDYFAENIKKGNRITDIVKDPVLLDKIFGGESFDNYIYCLGHQNYSVNFIPMNSSSKENTENLIIFRRIEEIQDKEYAIRRQLLKKGHIARYKFSQLIYDKSSIFADTVQEAKKYARTDSTILITGESGTGKEMFAQSIHNESTRKNGPFVAINCAALPENLLESELFGYVSGAFTGARREGKPGLFELAHKGTIFLDEIGDMALSLQSRLLRVLEEREVMRLGDDKVIPVDVRIIAATNKDLKQKVIDGTFRDDLYYRLNVLNLEIPPLRARKQDIPILAQFFINEFCRKYKKKSLKLSRESLELLKNYQWPGNVRELKSMMERIVVLSENDDEKCKDILARIMNGTNNVKAEADKCQNELSMTIRLSGSFKDIQRQLIDNVIKKTNNIQQAAKLLGLSKATIWRRMVSK